MTYVEYIKGIYEELANEKEAPHVSIEEQAHIDVESL